MNKLNILVFPCGSEIGLEIYRSLRYSRHINLYGGSSIDDHGKFVYDKYIGKIPFVNDNNIIPYLRKVVNKYKIDAIYPTMDSVITKLSEKQDKLGCKIICSSLETTLLCLSKAKTYEKFNKIISVPKIFKDIDEIDFYPVFIKPDSGYGSRGALKVNNKKELKRNMDNKPNLIILEYLEGHEYTVDCFTDRHGNLLFIGPRIRKRIRNGISVNTISVEEGIEIFEEIAHNINRNLELRGAWFFQLKENKKGDLVLLEIASRLGGSSTLFRIKGVNFALLSVFDAFDKDVKICLNTLNTELDRALENKYKVDFNFETAYIDFDDCLIINNKVNTELLRLIFQFINEGKKVILLTKHYDNIQKNLEKYRLQNIFDEIIQIPKDAAKTNYINNRKSIFIDDSFSERLDVNIKLNIPVFSPDAIECLFNIN